MRKRHYESDRSKFTALENHFLNTFFSGIYFSATDFIEMGSAVDIPLKMNSREMLIKELLNTADQQDRLAQTIALLNQRIDQRIQEYHRLSIDYPGALAPLAKLAQKANGTKSLLARESRGNPYE